MKVNIGPYRDRWVSSIHRNYMDKKYGVLSPENQTRFEVFLEWVQSRLQSLYDFTINKVLDKRERKTKVKVDDYDVWNAEHTLAMVIYPTLRYLMEAECGAPDVDNEDVPEHMRREDHYPVTEDGFVGSDDAWFERWHYVLNEMTWTFSKLSDPDWEHDEYFHDGLVEGMRQFPSDEGIGKVLETPDFSVDEEGLEQANKRIEEGLRLFGKYFRSMWT